jgi:hypothetical protein
MAANREIYFLLVTNTDVTVYTKFIWKMSYFVQNKIHKLG